MFLEMYTKFGKVVVHISNRGKNPNKTKVKMVPYGLLTIRHFSSPSVRSETVGCAFVTQPMRFYRPV